MPGEGDDCRGCEAVDEEEHRAVLQRLPGFGKGALELVKHVDIHHQEGLLQWQFHIGVIIVIMLTDAAMCHAIHQYITEIQQVIQIIHMLVTHRNPGIAVDGWLEQRPETQHSELRRGYAETVCRLQPACQVQCLLSEVSLDERM